MGAVAPAKATALFLTGRPGVGKTTVIRAVVAQLASCAGGFYTEEIRERRQRTGFRLIALYPGIVRVGTLASVNISSPCRVGNYGVDLVDLDRVGVAALVAAVEDPRVDVVVIDEIGKMELYSSAFRRAVLRALASPKPVLATVMARPERWVDAIKARQDVSLVEVTVSNRQAMPERVLRWLGRAGACETTVPPNREE
jgi:nucleoside-triphosphatase